MSYSTDEKDLDKFWDIDSLIPTRQDKKSASKISFDTNTVEITSHTKPASSKEPIKAEALSTSEFRRFIPPFSEKDIEEAPAPDFEYTKANSLINRVKIYNWQNKYVFYERFTDDARRLWKSEGTECRHVPFFSYTPQYTQLNRDQFEFYLWWRHNVRLGNYIEADYSYILLYVYELINLSDTLKPDYCLGKMCDIWLNYGKKHAFLSRYLAEWVCDLCLIYNLDPPVEKIKELYPQIMKECTLKEFYTSYEQASGGVSAKMLVDISGAYDFKKSKCATADRIPVMETHLMGALDHVLKRLALQGKSLLNKGDCEYNVIRSSFTGALCSPHIKKKIYVEYRSFAHSYELKYLVSDILKYSENRLRKLWSIKSRLSIYALPTEIKGYVDEYFDKISRDVRISRAAKKSEAELEYEKLYKAPDRPFSIDRADLIESESWDTTKLLVETFEEEEQSVKTTESVSTEKEISENDTDIRSALGERYEFVVAVGNEDVAMQRKIADRLGVLAEAIVDEINEIAFDVMGDVLIEDDGEKYIIIEEYKELVMP